MTIYGEDLFLENFITGMAILVVVARICKIKINKYRLILGGILCGIYGFIIFIQIPSFAITVTELIFAPLVTAVALGKGSTPSLIRTSILFLIVTFLWGGVTIAILMMTGDESIIVGTITYMSFAIYLRLIAALTGGYAVILLTVSIIKEQRLRGRIIGVARLGLSSNTVELKASIDSGNFLKDPISGIGVSLISAAAAGSLGAALTTTAHYVAIPYKTVDTGTRILDGYRIDYIDFREKRYSPAIIAVAPRDLGDIELLLSAEMLERGLNEDYS